MKNITLTISSLLLAFTAFAQIPNPSFEIWDEDYCGNTQPDSIPEDWETPCSDFLAYTSGFSPTEDAYSGNFASQLNPALIGDFSIWYAPTIMHTSFTVDFIPVLFSGYYKFESQRGDSALVEIYFKEYNTNTTEFDTIATMRKILHPVNQYTLFEVSVPEIAFQSPPDSVIIYISSAYIDIKHPYDTDGQTDGILHVDNLDIVAPVGIDEKDENQVQVYPVPASDVLNIKGLDQDWNNYQLTDALGRLVAGGKLSNSQIQVDAIPPGNYTITFSNGEESIIQKIVIER